MGTFLFEAGEIYMTNNVNEKCRKDLKFNQFCLQSFGRHLKGDWGDADDETQVQNDNSIKDGDGVILSMFNYKDDTMLWILTESDRSETTLLFPEEY